MSAKSITSSNKMDYFVKAYKDWKLHSQFQEIVPDMDDDYMLNEKQSIRESARSLKKYGSTCYNPTRADTLIRHEVEKTDTLQGIALKYGCTTEQIRRANRLFASDSLFLRQYLLIPVEKTSPFYPTLEENITGNVSMNARPPLLPARPYSIAGSELLSQADADIATYSRRTNSTKQSKSLDSVVTTNPDDENRKCINDFLKKIDTTISESRKYVEKSKDMVTHQNHIQPYPSVDGINRQPRRQNAPHLNNLSNHQRHPNNVHSNSSGSASPDTIQLLNTTQLRRVQNSLKRLEKQQDEYFEL